MVLGQWEAKGFLPPSMAQTNNRAELQAVITVQEHFRSVDLRLVIITDSQYIYDGLNGAMGLLDGEQRDGLVSQGQCVM